MTGTRNLVNAWYTLSYPEYPGLYVEETSLQVLGAK
jgi:hypothetical protein